MAVMIGSAAVIVGSTLEAPPSADDYRIFFVIGAGLSAIVLFLIAGVWRFLTIKRGGGAPKSTVVLIVENICKRYKIEVPCKAVLDALATPKPQQ